MIEYLLSLFAGIAIVATVGLLIGLTVMAVDARRDRRQREFYRQRARQMDAIYERSQTGELSYDEAMRALDDMRLPGQTSHYP